MKTNKKVILFAYASILAVFLLSWPATISAAVLANRSEVKNSPEGETMLVLNAGTGVEILGTLKNWSKIRFRVTNPNETVDGDFIKPNSKLYIFAQDFNWDKKYGSIGKTLKKVKIEIFPFRPSAKISGYIVGYINKNNLTTPIVEKVERLSKLKSGYYFRLDFVDFKTKTYDVGAAWDQHPVFCDFRVNDGQTVVFTGGAYREMLVEFTIDVKGNIKGETCFDTFCIEKFTIEGPKRFSAMVSGIKQTFVSTENMKEYSDKQDDD